MTKKKSAYAEAGVDIDMMDNALRRAKKQILSTVTKGVASEVGSFGGLFEAPGKDALLVSSIDGVGTKLKVASMAGCHDTVGQDLVNHCTNDILVQGARPLFFLDYIGAAKLDPGIFGDVVKGLAKACRANGCALLGGETAEMPGLYPEGEYDLVGTIIGAVEKKNVITGDKIRKGDVLIGLPSTGLHTNGFSLARKVIFEKAGLNIDDVLPGTKKTVADILLAVHRSYLKPVRKLMAKVKVRGMAHITGGGLVDNIPRILPKGLGVGIDRSTWKTPPVFDFMREAGKIDREEMYRVFNMGIGMVVIVREKDAADAVEILKNAKAGPKIIGLVVEDSKRKVRFVD
ncbi:MAG: phosphoribosylformylglycinamidine cyclo-ligase [Verrucomicrobia bacterium]|nr:phosphoribosylformylglycinamidine cyclo-ligase [Verrucomicrobiota bacterium]